MRLHNATAAAARRSECLEALAARCDSAGLHGQNIPGTVCCPAHACRLLIVVEFACLSVGWHYGCQTRLRGKIGLRRSTGYPCIMDSLIPYRGLEADRQLP
jgi:hypothetical protein